MADGLIKHFKDSISILPRHFDAISFNYFCEDNHIGLLNGWRLQEECIQTFISGE